MTSNLIYLMADVFDGDQMRSLSTYWGSMIGPIDHAGGGFQCVCLAAVHRDAGVILPCGGMAGIMNAMAASAADRRAEIRTGARVAHVLVSG